MRSILHLSDIHFGPRHRPDAAEAALALAAERRPSLVVLSGDHTQRAKPSQFRAARAFADRFESPVLAIPGNHDVPLYRVWERVFAPFGAYRRHFARDLEPEFEDDELLVVSVNTAFAWTLKDGRFLHRRLAAVAARLAATPRRVCRVAVVHHELVPAPGWDLRTARDAWAASEAFAAAGVELALAGHRHVSFLAFSRPEVACEAGRRFPILHAGTSCSSRGRGAERGRNSLNWIEVGERELTLETWLLDPASRRFRPAATRRLARAAS